MINTQSIFLDRVEVNKRGKENETHEVVPIARTKSLDLKSTPTIANRHWDKLLDKVNPSYFQENCSDISLTYDAVNEEYHSKIESVVSYIVGVPNIWFSVSVINGEKFLGVAETKMGDGYVSVLEGSNMTIRTDSEEMNLSIDRNFSSINNHRFVVANRDFFENKVVQKEGTNHLEVLAPITNEQLDFLSNSTIQAIEIETATSQITMRPEPEYEKLMRETAKCGVYLK